MSSDGFEARSRSFTDDSVTGDICVVVADTKYAWEIYKGASWEELGEITFYASTGSGRLPYGYLLIYAGADYPSNHGDIYIAPGINRSTILGGVLIAPYEDGGVNIGSASYRFSNVYVAGDVNCDDQVTGSGGIITKHTATAPSSVVGLMVTKSNESGMAYYSSAGGSPQWTILTGSDHTW
jgi:hypothetical protein